MPSLTPCAATITRVNSRAERWDHVDTDHIDTVLCDLDGVVWLAHEPIVGSVEAIAQLRASGRRVMFVTNNAARSAQVAIDHLNSLGFQADGFEQPLEKLQEARIPAIVLINENGYQHFVVVKGLQTDRVLIGDPAQGTRALPRKAFDAMWKSGLLFVIHSHRDQARFNLATDWRVAPRAPLAGGVSRDGMAGITLPKQGPGDF